MKMKSMNLLLRAAAPLTALATLIGAISVQASPSLSVRKPPVVSGPNPNTGPAGIDPLSIQGQWFVPAAGGAPQYRNNEFHDNISGQGGGVLGSKAIHGIVSVINYTAGPGTNIIGFRVRATISNDTMTSVGGWQPGFNSHGESRTVQILVTEFALNNTALFPAGPVAGTPYVPSPGPRILAVNHDMLAWYCFNNTPAPVTGRYYVPGWQFPNIAPGASATLELQFRVVDGGLVPADPRYPVLVNSLTTGQDMLSNRSVSLKIRSWLQTLWLDNGVAYFPIANRNSNAAVFHTAP
jgi:hypothetical protein